MNEQLTREDLRDMIAEAIDDSMDMDWQSSWGADAILARLEKEGLCITHDLPGLVEKEGLLNAGYTFHGKGPHGRSFEDYSLQWGPYDDRSCASGRTLKEALTDRGRIIVDQQVQS